MVILSWTRAAHEERRLAIPSALLLVVREQIACDSDLQTKPSAPTEASRGFGVAAPRIEMNWSLVGSAQQYHGSLRNGTAAGVVGTRSPGASRSAATWA